MRELLDQSLEQGAIGMSSGLFYRRVERRLDRRGGRGRPAARQVGRRLHRPHARRGRPHPEGDGRDLRDRPPRRRRDHRLASQVLGPQQFRPHEGDAAQVHRGDEEAADRLRRLSLHRRLDDPAHRHAGARRQGADHLVGQGAGHERPRPRRHRQGDGLLDEGGRRPHAAGRRHLLHDGREGRAGGDEPSRRDDRLGRHSVRRPSASAPVGHLPARARPLLARPQALPAGGRGAPHDVVLGAALPSHRARPDQAGLLRRHLRVRSGDGDRHRDLREADDAGRRHRHGAVQRR